MVLNLKIKNLKKLSLLSLVFVVCFVFLILHNRKKLSYNSKQNFKYIRNVDVAKSNHKTQIASINFPQAILNNGKFEESVKDSKLNLSQINKIKKPENDLDPRWVVGKTREFSKMVVGIPSLARKGADYINQTMDWLLKRAPASTTLSNNVTFLIYFADSDDALAKKRAKNVQNMFPKEIDNGTIQLISSPKVLFPDWESNLEKNFDDTLERIKWRSKQNLDMRFIISYTRRHFDPDYFLMMEDDVEPSPNYLDIIFQVAEKKPADWLICDFTNIGGAGKLFKRKSLHQFESLLSVFWGSKPLDWLLWDFLSLKLCGYGDFFSKCEQTKKQFVTKHSSSLFSHRGVKSSAPKQ